MWKIKHIQSVVTKSKQQQKQLFGSIARHGCSALKWLLLSLNSAGRLSSPRGEKGFLCVNADAVRLLSHKENKTGACRNMQLEHASGRCRRNQACT